MLKLIYLNMDILDPSYQKALHRESKLLQNYAHDNL